MRRQDTSLDNEHCLIVGTSGSGKSSAVKARLRSLKPKRLLMWDPDQEYDVPARNRFDRVAPFVAAVKTAAASGRAYRLALSTAPTVEHFERFCRVVWALRDADAPVTAVIEELADVSTTAGKASPAWGELIRRGRKYGIRLIAVSQSPTEISKTIYRNTGLKVSMPLESEADRKRLAQELDVDTDQLRALANLEYIAKWQGKPPKTGRVRFVRGVPKLEPDL